MIKLRITALYRLVPPCSATFDWSENVLFLKHIKMDLHIMKCKEKDIFI